MVEVTPDFEERGTEVLAEIVQYSSSCDDLWSLSERGFLFKLFQTHGSAGSHLALFFDEVNKVIDMRRKMLNSESSGKKTRGKILLFDPSSTMYDGVAEDVTEGFFDSDDLPPPSFWLGVNNEKLEVFIPSAFLIRANEGVENCMSSCLEWATEEFEVTL